MNASADSSRAPLVHKAWVAARAAKEQDEEMSRVRRRDRPRAPRRHRDGRQPRPARRDCSHTWAISRAQFPTSGRTMAMKFDVLFSSRLGKDRGGAEIALPSTDTSNPMASSQPVVAEPGPVPDRMVATSVIHEASLTLAPSLRKWRGCRTELRPVGLGLIAGDAPSAGPSTRQQEARGCPAGLLRRRHVLHTNWGVVRVRTLSIPAATRSPSIRWWLSRATTSTSSSCS